jgi:rhodanese-related sulfurtransferase
MKRMLTMISLCWLASVSAGTLGTIEPADLAARLTAGDTPALLDVRAPTEYAGGHLAGAVNIAHNELAARIAELPFDRKHEVVVYCRSGSRAKLAADVLLNAGFTDVRLMTGHILQWQAESRPLVKE